MALSGMLTPLFGRRKIDAFWPTLLAWPPNLFAVTHWILEETSFYTDVVSPPATCRWPLGFPSSARWHEELAAHAKVWRRGLSEVPVKLPADTARWFDERRVRLASLLARKHARDVSWEEKCALYDLHAVADEACEGFGIVGGSASGDNGIFELEAELHLTDTGSLALFDPEIIRVLPKLRTPQVGMTLRSLSNQVCALKRTPAIQVAWRSAGDFDRDDPSMSSGSRDLRLLLFPWPHTVDERTFRQAAVVPSIGMSERFGFFDFVPDKRLDISMLEPLVIAATEHDPLHAIVLPEAALTPGEFDDVAQLALAHNVPCVLSGVRGERENYARLCFPRYGTDIIQHKHHRWYLDEGQINQYEISASLPTAVKWWENIAIPPRTLSFTCFNEWLTFCHVICEDLARLDPVEQLVRAVGPTLLIALLQDGPQVQPRWSWRYASVYADDPGCSVLTFTSLGMAERSRYKNDPPNRTIAHWSEPGKPSRPLRLAPDKHGILLSLHAEWIEEFTADGRTDGQTASCLRYVRDRSL